MLKNKLRDHDDERALEIAIHQSSPGIPELARRRGSEGTAPAAARRRHLPFQPITARVFRQNRS
jgi:hypothetical protein